MRAAARGDARLFSGCSETEISERKMKTGVGWPWRSGRLRRRAGQRPFFSGIVCVCVFCLFVSFLVLNCMSFSYILDIITFLRLGFFIYKLDIVTVTTLEMGLTELMDVKAWPRASRL